MSETTTIKLDVEGLEVRRGERRLIRDLSFALPPGGKAVIVGPNGSGKTSLLRVIAGLSPCAAGRVALNDCAMDRLSAEHRAEIAYRAHLDGLKRDLTIRENLECHRALAGRGPSVDTALESVGLAGLGARLVRHLSAGQRRRAGLATLRCTDARLWILDEPMTNLDAEGRAFVAHWIDEHVARGGLAVVATHQPEELAGPGTLLVEL